MATKAALARRVLKRLSLLDPDENPSAQEQADIETVMDAVHEELKEDGKLTDDITSLPARYQEPFIDLVAARVAPDFGAESQAVLIREQAARKRIAKLSAITHNPKSNPYRDY